MLTRRLFLGSSFGLLAPSQILAQSVGNDKIEIIDEDPDKPKQTIPERRKSTGLTVSASDLDRARRRMAAFFDRAVALSVGSPPPGTNASNGWFTNGMVNDAELDIYQRPLQSEDSGGIWAADLSLSYISKVRAPFGRGLHAASGLTYLPLAKDTFIAALPGVVSLVIDILAAIYSDGASTARTSIGQQVQADIDQMGRSIAERGMVTSGEHPNGYISGEMRDRMTEFLTDKTFSTNLGPDGNDYKEIIKVLATKMRDLPTDGHDPWLRADWQLRFTAISMTAAKVMKNPPA